MTANSYIFPGFMLKTSKREDLIDYRPHSHNEWHQYNGVFDLSYSAFLAVKSMKDQAVSTVIDNKTCNSSSLIEFVNDLKFGQSKVTMCSFVSNLSEMDRVLIMESIVKRFFKSELSRQSNSIFMSVNRSHRSSIDSCQQLLANLLSDLLFQPEVIRVLKSASNLINIERIDNSYLFSHAKEIFTIVCELIYQNLLQYQETHQFTLQLIIHLNFLENISIDTLNQFLHFVKQWQLQSQEHYQIFIITNCQINLISRYEEHCDALRYQCHHYQYSLISSQELFSNIFEEIIFKSHLPVSFPPKLLAYLYEEFHAYTSCVSTFLNR
jgi:hypothetical protein